MLLSVLAISFAQPVAPMPHTLLHGLSETAAAAPAPCNPDPMKSIGCASNRYEPARKTAVQVPIVCNHDPLKGAACHAQMAAANAEKRSREQLASADD